MMIAARIDLTPGEKPLPLSGYISLYINTQGQAMLLFPDNTETMLGGESMPVGQFPVGTTPTNKIYAQRNFGGF